MSLLPSMYYDEVAVRNAMTPTSVVSNLTLKNVESFLRSLGVSNVAVYSDYLICPTICHNTLENAESMKLYYYDDSKSFHCFTQCSENFNIIELYRRYMRLNHQEITYEEAVEYIKQFVSGKEVELVIDRPFEEVHVPLITEMEFVQLPSFNPNAMDVFIKYPHPLWLGEGIGKETMEKFDIRYSILQNKIIIPHHDIDGKLIGIRARALNPEDIERGKYMPIKVGDVLYNHQLGFNLYGLDKHKEAIKKLKRAIIYESEKSVLLDDTYYGKYSTAVATCGSQLNKFQINLLIKKLGVSEIILAYDKEFVLPYDNKGKEYRKKLIDKCNKYKGLAQFYYIFDERNLLHEKDAPCDRGQEILEQLMKGRIAIK